MRYLWLYAYIILLAMAKKVCDGCGKPQVNLKNHESTCQALLDFVGGGFKRLAEEEARAEGEKELKRRRDEEERQANRDEKRRKAAERQVCIRLRNECHSVIPFCIPLRRLRVLSHPLLYLENL